MDKYTVFPWISAVPQKSALAWAFQHVWSHILLLESGTKNFLLLVYVKAPDAKNQKTPFAVAAKLSFRDVSTLIHSLIYK